MTTAEDQIVQHSLNELLNDSRFKLIPDKAKKPIKRLVFSLISSDEIRSMSTGEITQTKLNNKEGSLYSLRMGAYDTNRCTECGQKEDKCLGHFGHIELPKPIINMMMLGYICKLLNLICPYCAQCSIMDFYLLKIKEKGFKRFEKLATDLSVTSKKMTLCGHCRQSKYLYYPNGYDVYMCDPSKKAETATFVDPSEVERILKNISDETLDKIGFHVKDALKMSDSSSIGLTPNAKWRYQGHNRPEWAVMSCIPVMPNCDRAPSKIGGILRHDDITDKYISIFRTCLELKKVIDSKEDWKDVYSRLQEHYYTLIDNTKEISKYQNNGRAHNTIAHRLKGKSGYFRQNAQGKRTNFGGRSVVTCEVNMSIEEVRLPPSITNEVTVPEIVTAENKDRLMKLALQGKISMINTGNRLTSARVWLNKLKQLEAVGSKEVIELEPGWSVERAMQPGDIVIINREPALHRQNLIALKMANMPEKGMPDSIGFHPSNATGLNLDFDGDEMNVYVLQVKAAQEEAWELMNPVKIMISDQTSSLINGPVQDHLSGSMLLTDERVVFTREQFMQCVAQLKDYDVFTYYREYIKRVEKFYTYPYRGKTLFSIMLPSNFVYTRKNKFGLFKVIDGVLISGVATKGIIYDIIHQLKKNWGDKYALSFQNNINYLINWYLQAHYSFSIGLDDCLDNAEPTGPLPQGQFLEKKPVPKRISREELLEITRKAIRRAEIEVERINMDPSYNALEKEIYTNNALNSCMSSDEAKIHPDNSIAVCIESGGKGKSFNERQLRLAIGQQNIYGVRPAKVTARGRRCNIYCPLDDDTPKYRGFIEQSYIDGMSPLSFIFHAMGAREGLINTSCSTAETGYSQRSMIKKTEDNHVDDAAVVRASGNRILQPLYGGDGLSARELIETPGMDTPQFIDIQRTVDAILSDLQAEDGLQSKVDKNWMFPKPITSPQPKKSTVLSPTEMHMESIKEILQQMKNDSLTEKQYMVLWTRWWNEKEILYRIRKGVSPKDHLRIPTENDDGLIVVYKNLLYSYRKRGVTAALDKNGNKRNFTEKERKWCKKNWVSIIPI